MTRQWSLPIVALAGVALLWLGTTFGMKWALMALIGFGFGFTLSFSRFGIVFGWREMLTRRNSYYVRVHLLTIAIEILLFTAFLYVVVNLLVDLLYPLLDPRVTA